MLLDAVGRAMDLSQIAMGHVVLRPLFAQLRAHGRLAGSRHEPFAARGEVFVKETSLLGKAAFLSKMLGSDGGWENDSGLPAPVPQPTDAPEILFAGDLLSPGRASHRSLSDALRARIAAAACFVVNLEGTIGAEANDIAPLLTPRGFGQLLGYAENPTNDEWVSRFDEASLRELLGDARRVAVSVANNHTLDDGLAGFDGTLASARNLGFDVVGDARGEDGTALLEVGQHRVGLFAVTYGSNRSSETSPHLRFHGVPYSISRRRIEAVVERLVARGATHVVALLHWGYEHEHEPSLEQRHCGEVLLDAGVSAIVGHHPHLVQPSTQHRGRWVSYSLGDFVGGDRTIWSRFGALVSLRFLAEGRVSGELVPTVQTPFWQSQRTMLLSEAPTLERRVFARYFAERLVRVR